MFTNGNGNGAEPHFDNAKLEQCIAVFQRNGDTPSLSEIVALSERRALTLIRHYGTGHYCAEAELLSDINFKLLRSVARFDPRKGSAFTFVSKIIDSSLRTSVTATRKNWVRHPELSDELTTTVRDPMSLDDVLSSALVQRGIYTVRGSDAQPCALPDVANSRTRQKPIITAVTETRRSVAKTWN